jgi:macrolide-specific efflux system membrane fusion protein
MPSPPSTSLVRRLARPALIAPLVVLLALGVWWFAVRSGGSTNTAGATITTAPQLVAVTSGTVANTVSADGTVAAADTDDLSFGTSGTVTAVNVAAGDTVTAGEVLATIDSADLQSTVTSATSTLVDAYAKWADDTTAGASSAQLTADETSVVSAADALATAKAALSGASLVATFGGTVASVDLTVGEQLGSSGGGGTSTTGTGSGSGQSTAPLGSGTNSSSNSSSSSSTAQI